MQTSRTRRASATERFHREARKKRLSPVAILLGLIGAGLLVAIGVILFGGGTRISNVRDRIEQCGEEAARRDSEGDLKGAIAIYRKALELARPHPELRPEFVRLRSTIQEVESRWRALAAARSELEGFLKKCESACSETAAALLEEGQRLTQKYQGASLELLARVKAQCVRLGHMIPRPGPSPAVYRARVDRECGLGDRKKADFAKAVRLWDEYLKSVRKKEWEARALLYRENVDRWAREAAHSVRRAAERRIEAKDTAGAESLLRKERPRFEGTAGLEILR